MKYFQLVTGRLYARLCEKKNPAPSSSPQNGILPVNEILYLYLVIKIHIHSAQSTAREIIVRKTISFTYVSA